MIVILKPGSQDSHIEQVLSILRPYDVSFNISKGSHVTVIGLVGDTTSVDRASLETNPHVERVMKVTEPFKKSNRKFHPENTVVEVSGRRIGGDAVAVIAGPCSVESEAQICEVAHAVKESGAMFLRGGAFKPRTSPYAFQGLALEGLELLKLAREGTGLPIVTEIMSSRYLDAFLQEVDVIQVGARNMQNFDLLKELGATKKPILLKRGLSSTIEEWLMSAEYIMAGGNPNVILCERGIRTFETYTRNTLDLSAIPVVKRLSHLPVIVDPSHATGMSALVEPLAKAAVAAGADGVIVEVHNNPEKALCDGPQSITPEAFSHLMQVLDTYAKAEGRSL